MRGTGRCWIAVLVLLVVSAAEGAMSDEAPRHLIYLHGRIVQEQQDARPRHPQYGYYELDRILQTFRDRGFVVSGPIRPKSATVSESADVVVTQVRRLLASGVSADHITVVGGSMGASIALLTSVRLQNPNVRFCTLGACLSENIRALLTEEGKPPSGYLLSIREASDDTAGSCPAWKDDPESTPRLVAREIVLKTGLNHGFLYRPLPEWVDPVVEWARLHRLQASRDPDLPLPAPAISPRDAHVAPPPLVLSSDFARPPHHRGDHR